MDVTADIDTLAGLYLVAAQESLLNSPRPAFSGVHFPLRFFSRVCQFAGRWFRCGAFFGRCSCGLPVQGAEPRLPASARWGYQQFLVDAFRVPFLLPMLLRSDDVAYLFGKLTDALPFSGAVSIGDGGAENALALFRNWSRRNFLLSGRRVDGTGSPFRLSLPRRPYRPVLLPCRPPSFQNRFCRPLFSPPVPSSSTCRGTSRRIAGAFHDKRSALMGEDVVHLREGLYHAVAFQGSRACRRTHVGFHPSAAIILSASSRASGRRF